jgi:hypothetical protein
LLLALSLLGDAGLLLALSLLGDALSELVEVGVVESVDEFEESDEEEFDEDPVEVFAVGLSLRA